MKNIFFNQQTIIYTLLLFIFFSCARAPVRSPVKNRREALRLTTEIPVLSDDLELRSLIDGLKKEIEFLEKNPVTFLNFQFANNTYTTEEYLQGLHFLVDKYYKGVNTKESFLELLKENFDFYEVYGREDYGEVLVTSYFEPVIKGSLVKSKKYDTPIYLKPDDMIEVNLKEFIKAKDYGLDADKLSKKDYLVGRLAAKKNIRDNYVLLPYYSRQEIDDEGVIQKEDLKLCYVDRVDSFFLQIQGSGTIIFDSGERVRVGFAAQNGRRYVPIGNELREIIPADEMGLASIEEHLRKLPKNKLSLVLNKNPSYVFFRKLNGPPVTTLGTEVIDGRTIAADLKLFPKGALAFLTFERPVFKNKDDKHPHKFVKTSRLVLDQDSGGAIYGPGRVDLYAGSGNTAKKHAGITKSKGRLYYLAPKRSLLSSFTH